MNVTTKRLQQEGTPKQPSSPRKKRKQLGQGKNNAPKKKRIRTKCSSEGCTNNAQIGGVCIRHADDPIGSPGSRHENGWSLSLEEKVEDRPIHCQVEGCVGNDARYKGAVSKTEPTEDHAGRKDQKPPDSTRGPENRPTGRILEDAVVQEMDPGKKEGSDTGAPDPAPSLGNGLLNQSTEQYLLTDRGEQYRGNRKHDEQLVHRHSEDTFVAEVAGGNGLIPVGCRAPIQQFAKAEAEESEETTSEGGDQDPTQAFGSLDTDGLAPLLGQKDPWRHPHEQESQHDHRPVEPLWAPIPIDPETGQAHEDQGHQDQGAWTELPPDWT